MDNVKTINVIGLTHNEKEKTIFSNIEQLKHHEKLKIIAEFNPIPLVYMLKARNEFEINYEKEGPDEWILAIKRIASTREDDEKKEQLKKLLKELKEGEIREETKEKVKSFLQKVDATTLGFVEQELIREGVSHDEIRKSLCDVHLEILKDTLVSQKIELLPPHPIHTFMEEHKVIIKKLDEMRDLIERLKEKNNYESLEEDMKKLKGIAHHLIEAESHHKREEDALFPKLEKHNIVEPPNIMKMEHIELRKRKQELHEVVNNPTNYKFNDFKQKVSDLGGYLVKELNSHIFKEDNILYQISLQVLTEEEWDEIKKECDEIGYCCFTPTVTEIQENMNTLDLRTLPPSERHEKIFQVWDALKVGQSLRIINDHNPKPLYYQFEAEYKGHYRWEYELSGPIDWIVRIEKIN